MPDLDLMTKAELNLQYPEDQRWEKDQLKRIPRDELLADVKKFLSQTAPVATVTVKAKTKEVTRLPMRRLTTKNRDWITEAVRPFFESMNVSLEGWSFMTTKYDDDRGTRLEISHLELGVVEIYWTTHGYVFGRSS